VSGGVGAVIVVPFKPANVRIADLYSVDLLLFSLAGRVHS